MSERHMPIMGDREMYEFLHRSNDGNQWDATEADSFDYRGFYDYYSGTSRLLLSKDEFDAATEGDRPADRRVDVFLNLSCGSATTPHLIPESVGVMKALGVDFVAAVGRRYCCAKIYRAYGRDDTADRVLAGSVSRIQRWRASRVVHGCPSCHIYYSRYLDSARPEYLRESFHFATFLADRLAELGDRVPWQREVRARVLVEDHGVPISPVHDALPAILSRMLAMVPGVEVVGRWGPSTLGAACALGPDGQGQLAFLSEAEKAQVRAELRAQAADAGGADVLVTTDKQCQRDWCKFATSALDVRSYTSIVADGLGCAQPDRFKTLWQADDPDEVHAVTRPYWSSWGLTEEQGRWLAVRNFDREHSNWRPRCACGGNPANCNTGRLSG